MLSNVDIFELERKLFRYRLKQKLHYIIFAILSLSVGGIIFYYYTYTFPNTSLKVEASSVVVDTNLSSVKPDINITKEEVREKISLIEVPIEEKNQEITHPTQTLFLQLPIVKTNNADKKSFNPPVSKDASDKKYLPEITEDDIENKVLMRKMRTKAEDTFYRNTEETIESTLLAPPPLEDERPKGRIKIETQEVNSIVYLKDKFEKTQNIIFALMLAEEYYLSKNYNESNKWALIANSIDSDNEKSWIWFAKSKVKLGQREDASLALKAYLKNNKSKTIESLLSQIAMGEIQ